MNCSRKSWWLASPLHVSAEIANLSLCDFTKVSEGNDWVMEVDSILFHSPSLLDLCYLEC